MVENEKKSWKERTEELSKKSKHWREEVNALLSESESSSKKENPLSRYEYNMLMGFNNWPNSI